MAILALLGIGLCIYALVILRRMAKRRAPRAGDYLGRVICWTLVWWLGEVLSDALRPQSGQAGYYVLAWLSLLVYLASIVCLLVAGYYTFFKLIPALQPSPVKKEEGIGSGEQGTENGEPGTGNGEKGTGSGERATGNRERGTGKR